MGGEMTKANFWNWVAVRLIGLVLALPINLTVISSWSADTSSAQAAAITVSSQAVFESEHIYQGPGGDVHFTVSGELKSQPDMHALLCWKPSASVATCRAELRLRRLRETQDPPGVVYAVTIPREFKTSPNDKPEHGLFGLVPIAELTITAGDDSTPKWQVVREIGVTSRWLAAVLALFAVLGAGIILYRFAIYLGVPGPKPAGFFSSLLRGFSVPLRLISTANGWASLSQFQIILWTFVIGAGAVYVMSLTGSLIAISTGTLALLGIAGAATVLSEVKSSQGSQASPTLAPPGKVAFLALVGQPRQTEIVAAWYPPNGSAAPITYIVQYASPTTPVVWHTACRALRATSVRIVGLSPGTAYQLRVLASNVAGAGPDEMIPAPTAAGTNPMPSITGLQMQEGRTGTSIPLAWNEVSGQTYVLEKRPHDSDAEWNAIVLENPRNHKATVPNLIANTLYDFRVRTDAVPDAWSPVETFSTGIRTPKWSDIVTDTDRPAAIDVTRVQMLFFTIISALFVALNIADTGTMPDIDPSYVTLMGISNGVYVTAKFVRA
jgi:hypothetical protein